MIAAHPPWTAINANPRAMTTLIKEHTQETFDEAPDFGSVRLTV
jgi:hypothetical protein